MHKLNVGTIYLRTLPNVCLERIRERGRAEEAYMSIEFLQDLHDKYDEVFLGQSSVQAVDGENTPEDLGQIALNIMYRQGILKNDKLLINILSPDF